MISHSELSLLLARITEEDISMILKKFFKVQIKHFDVNGDIDLHCCCNEDLTDGLAHLQEKHRHIIRDNKELSKLYASLTSLIELRIQSSLMKENLESLKRSANL